MKHDNGLSFHSIEVIELVAGDCIRNRRFTADLVQFVGYGPICIVNCEFLGDVCVDICDGTILFNCVTFHAGICQRYRGHMITIIPITNKSIKALQPLAR